MQTWYEKTLGIFWGQGWVENWGFLELYPQKSPKIIWGYFGDGVGLKIGVLSPKIPEKKSGIFLGRGF